jgi:hypothetical protein
MSVTIWVCVDCMFVHANGELPDPPPADRPWNRIPDSQSVSMGMLYSEHEEECPNRIAGEYVEECECEEITFAINPCDGCGSNLAGTRHAFTLWEGTE